MQFWWFEFWRSTSRPTSKATTRSKVSRTNSSKVVKLATAPALKTLTEGDEDLKRQFIASKEKASYPISQFKEVRKSKDGKYQFKVIKKGRWKRFGFSPKTFLQNTVCVENCVVCFTYAIKQSLPYSFHLFIGAQKEDTVQKYKRENSEKVTTNANHTNINHICAQASSTKVSSVLCGPPLTQCFASNFNLFC